MRKRSFTSALMLGVLALSPACQLPTNDSSSAASTDAPPAAPAPAEAAAAEPAAAKPAAAKSAPADAAPAAAKSNDKKKDKSDEEKSKEQKKWDDTLKDTEKATGLFTTHRGEHKLFIELDEKSLGREFLYHGHMNSGLGSGNIYRGAMLSDTPFVVHFERRNEKQIVLVAENTRYFEADDAREQRMLEQVTADSIIQAFPINAELEDEGRALIDIGAWFMSDNLSLARSLRGKFGPNRDLSAFTDVKSFPSNVEVYQELHFSGSSSNPTNIALADGRGVTLKVRHSLVALPEPGYKPRALDQRIGYFPTLRKDLFRRDGEDPVTQYINRWRLQKKDPSLDVSEPIKPITYWIENSTPPKLRGAVREGIEAWEPAFRKAGFQNGIIAKQMPEDADWDPADVRYAVVQWSEDENVGFAIGPSRTDPRTGEIYDADITMQASFLNTYAQRFDKYIAGRESMTKEDMLQMVQEMFEPDLEKLASMSTDATCMMMSTERAMQVSTAAMLLPALDGDFNKDDFLYAIIREVTAHEVGHTLGLRHNFKSSRWRSMEELGNEELTAAEGICGSFMDYPAINIAAPGKTQGEFFQSHVGAYDYWAIEYGYKEFGSNEEKALAKIAERSNLPGHEYGTDEDSFVGDPYTVTWDMGADPVAFAESQMELAEWGLANMLERGAEKGDGFYEYTIYRAMFQGMYDNAYRGLGRFLGGFTLNRDVVGQTDGRPPLVAVDADVQNHALDLMVDKGLRWDGGLSNEQVLLLANRKHGTLTSWFTPWSMTNVARSVNSSRFLTLATLMSTFLQERLLNQAALVEGAPSIHEVGDRVFAAVFVDNPDEHDLWIQKDWVSLATSTAETDTMPQILAANDNLIRRAQSKLEEYSGSSDRTVAAHGRWLSQKIKDWREKKQITTSLF
ncbi:MAG: hypothetical protein DHS20C15_23380 [Planctomycetota bacterium]|nr:MAG: hypothetical protein DHS20C15_23380 [Planctomycetota bacterium]